MTDDPQQLQWIIQSYRMLVDELIFCVIEKIWLTNFHEGTDFATGDYMSDPDSAYANLMRSAIEKYMRVDNEMPDWSWEKYGV